MWRSKMSLESKVTPKYLPMFLRFLAIDYYFLNVVWSIWRWISLAAAWCLLGLELYIGIISEYVARDFGVKTIVLRTAKHTDTDIHTHRRRTRLSAADNRVTRAGSFRWRYERTVSLMTGTDIRSDPLYPFSPRSFTVSSLWFKARYVVCTGRCARSTRFNARTRARVVRDCLRAIPVTFWNHHDRIDAFGRFPWFSTMR